MASDIINLVTYDGSLVTPKHDAVIREKELKNGILYGCTVTIKDTTTLHIAAGMGMLYGRLFEIVASDITVSLSSSGNLNGRLYVHMDLGNTDNPIQILTESAAVLSELDDDPNINIDNGSTDMQLATFTVGESTISDLETTYVTVGNMNNQIDDLMELYTALQSTVSNLFRATAVSTVNTGGPGVYVYYNTTPDSYAPDNINKGLLVNFCDPRWPTSTPEQPSYMYQILIVPENNSMYYRIWANGISYGQWYKINVTAAS